MLNNKVRGDGTKIYRQHTVYCRKRFQDIWKETGDIKFEKLGERTVRESQRLQDQAIDEDMNTELGKRSVEVHDDEPNKRRRTTEIHANKDNEAASSSRQTNEDDKLPNLDSGYGATQNIQPSRPQGQAISKKVVWYSPQMPTSSATKYSITDLHFEIRDKKTTIRKMSIRTMTQMVMLT